MDPPKQTVVYCHTGIRAAMTAAVLARLLGFRSVRLYHASWLEYGNQEDAVVETETETTSGKSRAGTSG